MRVESKGRERILVTEKYILATIKLNKNQELRVWKFCPLALLRDFGVESLPRTMHI